MNALIQAQYGRQTSRVKILMVGFLLLVFCDLRSLFSLLDISLRVKKTMIAISFINLILKEVQPSLNTTIQCLE